MAEYAKVWGTTTLALYFHGGLVDKATGLQWAGELIGPYSSHAESGGSAYPYFFVWESGVHETEGAWHAMCDLLGDRIHPSVLLPDTRQRIRDRFHTGRDHGMPNTEIEELLRQPGPRGRVTDEFRTVWGRMTAATACAFQGPPATHVGSKMIEQLAGQFWDKGKYPHITLLGHSAGAIHICEFLEAVEKRVKTRSDREQITFDVVFMAPAVRVNRFARTLTRARRRIARLRTFGLGDVRESADPLVPTLTLSWVYTRSLLYFIAGVCEDDGGDTPLLGMERFFAGTRQYTPRECAAIARVKHFLWHENEPRRVVWSPADDGPGLQCGATRHGGAAGEAQMFRDDCFPWEAKTLRSICYLLRTGDYA